MDKGTEIRTRRRMVDYLSTVFTAVIIGVELIREVVDFGDVVRIRKEYLPG